MGRNVFPWKRRAILIPGALLVVFLAGLWISGPRAAAGELPVSSAGQPAAGGPGQLLPAPQVEALPTATLAPQARPDLPAASLCPVPRGWVVYTVQPTDSLFRISLNHGITVHELQRANCLGEQIFLAPGSLLYVPDPSPGPAGVSAAVYLPLAFAHPPPPARPPNAAAPPWEDSRPNAAPLVESPGPVEDSDSPEEKEKGKGKGKGKRKDKGGDDDD
jgi:hypothetical protein